MRPWASSASSGCGKSVTAMSILGLVQRPGRVVGGEILFRGQDLLSIPRDELREIRGRDIAMIFQDPLSSLNPVHRVGFQLREAMRAHDKVAARDINPRTLELLRQVHVPDAARRIRNYPHQFSGGMRQRVMIAMGLVQPPGDPDRRRADHRPRRHRPGSDPPAPARSQPGARDLHHPHHSQPGGGGGDLPAGGGDVRRADRRGGAGGADLRTRHSIPTRGHCCDPCPASMQTGASGCAPSRASRRT